MIQTYTASPQKINKADFSKVGSGTGVNRYAYGMYFGEASTASHYLEQYQGYFDAAHSFESDGYLIEEGSPAYDVAKIIIRNQSDREAVKREINSKPKLLTALDVIWPEELDSAKLKFEYGVLHEVKIPDLFLSDLHHWDDTLSIDEARDYAEKIIDVIFAIPDEKTGIEVVHDLLFKAKEEAEEKIVDWIVNGNAPSEVQDLIDEEDEDLENSEIAENIILGIEDDIESEWMDIAIGNGYRYTQTDNHELFNIIMNELKSTKEMKSIVRSHSACFELHEDLTIGDFYGLTGSTCKDGKDEKQHASSLFSSVLRIDMLVASAMYGRDSAQELIALSEDALKRASFDPITKDEIEKTLIINNSEMSNDPESSYSYRY